MSPIASQSPFVAKAHFLPEKKWLGKYEKFWFQSVKCAPAGSGQMQQFKELKLYIEQAVIHNTSELIVFDNRPQFVSNYSEPQAQGVNIVARYVNGNLVEDFLHRLSFLDYRFRDDERTHAFFAMLNRSFKEIGGPNSLLPKGEMEQVREELHFQKWRKALSDYKKFMQSQSVTI